MALFLALLDQFRYMAGVLVMLFLLCHRALVHKERYAKRVPLSSFLMLSGAFLYIPYSRLVAPVAEIWPIVTAPYWVVMNLLPVAVVLYCYETNLPGALLRTMLASFTENIITVIIRYLIVLNGAPRLPEEHPALYILMMAALYTFFYWSVSCTLIRATRRDEHAVNWGMVRQEIEATVDELAATSMVEMHGKGHFPRGNRGKEAIYESRYFIVHSGFDRMLADMSHVSSYTEEDALQMAEAALASPKQNGFVQSCFSTSTTTAAGQQFFSSTVGQDLALFASCFGSRWRPARRVSRCPGC